MLLRSLAGLFVDGWRSGWCSCEVTVTTAIAGRRRELPAVTGVLTGGTDAVAMLVAGEAGVGKSRLVAAAAGVAAQADVTVLAGWCLPLSQGLPLLPVVDLLRGLGGLDEGRLLDSLLSDCPAFVRDEVARLLPELDESGEQTRAGEPVLPLAEIGSGALSVIGSCGEEYAFAE